MPRARLVDIDEPTEAGDDPLQALQPEFAVCVVAHDRLAIVAARRHVVEGAGKLEAERAGHAVQDA
jgi:hypothetical protein